MDIPTDQLVPIAQLLGLGILGIFAAFGLWWGGKRKTSAESTLEVAGALVDSSAVKELAAVLDQNNKEHSQNRVAAERDRAVMHRLCEVGEKIANEIEELRREIRQQGDTMTGRKR